MKTLTQVTVTELGIQKIIHSKCTKKQHVKENDFLMNA